MTMLRLVYIAAALCSFTSSTSHLISKVQSQCELEALNYGTRLVDQYQSFDENTEWDMRIHHDYLVQYLGFAGWIVGGLWKSGGLTASGANAPSLYEKGGWAGSKNVTESGYWPLEDKWLYMMGDSTQRQVWATFVSPFQNNQFERNAKEWTRENCARQYPHRKEHPSGGYFPEEGLTHDHLLSPYSHLLSPYSHLLSPTITLLSRTTTLLSPTLTYYHLTLTLLSRMGWKVRQQ